MVRVRLYERLIAGMNERHAFFFGFSVAHVGVPFVGVDVVDAAGRKAPGGALDALAQERIQAFRRGNTETIDRVLRAEAILLESELPTPSRPRTRDEVER